MDGAAARIAQAGAASTVPVADDAPIGDLRFMALLAPEDWAALPVAVRRRFSKRLVGGATAIYVGEVVEIEVSLAGRILAVAARAIGGPLPLVLRPGASVVTVTEDGATGGQVWTRMYARPRGFPQVIHSSKRFAGPTGLEEYVGCGVGMALTVAVEEGALVFRSDHYFATLRGWRIRLPRWIEPGRLTVSHAELGDGLFAFTLEFVHPLLGPLIRQRAVFRDS